MNPLTRISMAFAVALLTNVAGFLVLEYNQRQGVYRPQADTILIPIMENAFASVVILALISICILCGRGKRWVSGIGAVFGAAAIFLASTGVAHYAVPDHYLISLAFASLAGACIHFTYINVRGALRRRASID